MNVLTIDVGGHHVKFLASNEHLSRSFKSGRSMTPLGMVEKVKALTTDWSYDAISLGYPGLVIFGRIAVDPKNLARGWAGFDFGKSFGRPVRIMNDAAMQALGTYHEGRLLFLGLGTGLGAAMIVDGNVQPMELAHLPYRKGRTYEDYLGARGFDRLGRRKWRMHVLAVVELLRMSLEPEVVVVGGGNARRLEGLPKGVLRGENKNAFVGGVRMWKSASETAF